MNRTGLVTLAAVLLATLPATAQEATPAPALRANSTGGRSPHETTSTIIGERNNGNRVTITYGRPFSRDPRTGAPRRIWGALVPWEKAWRLGADEATLLLTQKPLVVGDVTIPAGAHTLYLVPSELGTSLLAFSTSLGKWGVPVDETSDLARVPVVKETIPDPVDQLTIAVVNTPESGGGVIRISWENTRFSLPFTVKN